MPSTPTDRVEPVMAYTCRPTATTVSWEPRLEMPRPTNSLRKGALARSGVRSRSRAMAGSIYVVAPGPEWRSHGPVNLQHRRRRSGDGVGDRRRGAGGVAVT